MHLFGETEFAYRLPSVLFGTLTIPLIFFFARNITISSRAALVAAFLTAFLMVEIAWSRQARMYQPFQFFYILTLYFSCMYIRAGRKCDAALAAVSAVCTLLSSQFAAPFLALTFVLLPEWFLSILKVSCSAQTSVAHLLTSICTSQLKAQFVNVHLCTV